MNFDDSCIYRDVSSNVSVAAADVRSVKFENIIKNFFCKVAVKQLATIYVLFVLKFIYEANDNLFPVVFCDFKTPSSADPTMNEDLSCMLFAAIEVNINYATLLALTSEIVSDLLSENGSVLLCIWMHKSFF